MENLQKVLYACSRNTPNPLSCVAYRTWVQQPRSYLSHGDSDVDEARDGEKDRRNEDDGADEARRPIGVIDGVQSREENSIH